MENITSLELKAGNVLGRLVDVVFEINNYKQTFLFTFVLFHKSSFLIAKIVKEANIVWRT